MPEFYTLLTTTGQNRLANAQVTGVPLQLTEIAVGSGENNAYYNPSEAQTALKTEVWRGPVGSLTVDSDNPNWIIVEAVIPDDQGGFYIREAGLFDSAGNLIAIGKFPESYKPLFAAGSNKQLHIRFVLQVTNAASVVLQVDPNVVLATQQWVLDRRYGRGTWKVIANGATLSAPMFLIPDNASAPCSYLLPASPVDGDFIEWMASETAFSTNKLTFQRNGKTIMGLAEDMEVTVDGRGGRLVWRAALNTWRVYRTSTAGT